MKIVGGILLFVAAAVALMLVFRRKSVGATAPEQLAMAPATNPTVAKPSAGTPSQWGQVIPMHATTNVGKQIKAATTGINKTPVTRTAATVAKAKSAAKGKR